MQLETKMKAKETVEEVTPSMESIVSQEERVLRRVQRALGAKRESVYRPGQRDYDAELIALRDQIREARMEDIPPLVEEMERLHHVAQRRAQVVEGMVDLNSPYFGRLVLEEDERKREVLIGRSTFLDSKTGIRIVDWRDAPVSRIYYRYEEGDDFDENFGGRDVEGDVLVRRSVAITRAKLRRIGCPQGTFLANGAGDWREAGTTSVELSGGQGTAMRPESHARGRTLGIGDINDEAQEDKHLSEITALIDARQFELISKATSGLVVIQGGAGSGKTTIGLHRLAYLNFQDRNRFRADRMLVVVFNDALVRYISRVLPALGVGDVPVTTYETWSDKLRRSHVPFLPHKTAEDTPIVVMRFKKHPMVLKLVEDVVGALEVAVGREVIGVAKALSGGAKVLRVWRASEGLVLGVRVETLMSHLQSREGKGLPVELRHAVERVLRKARSQVDDVLGVWADMLTDRARIKRVMGENAPEAFTEREVDWVVSWCARRCDLVLRHHDELRSDRREGKGEEGAPRTKQTTQGVDGRGDEDESVGIDAEDNTLLLRLVQSLRNPLMKRGSELRYEHIFVDEAQDLSPVEMAVVLGTVSKGESVTLAGDVAQRLHIDNGFSDWRSTLDDLGYKHVQIEPLRLSYRSTHEILDFANYVLGPLQNEVSGQAIRNGLPVEAMNFVSIGEAVGFLSEALRSLVRREPLASVAVVARYSEQADTVYRGLIHGEVPNLRRIAEQDFPFRPGVDVTDVRQVKGLEFDYVILVEVTNATYSTDDEARHLLHIAATRAIHQLWVLYTGRPSSLIPADLVKDHE